MSWRNHRKQSQKIPCVVIDYFSEFHGISWQGRSDGIRRTQKLAYHNTNTGQQHIRGSSPAPAGNCMRQRSSTYFTNTRVNSPTLFLCRNDNNGDIRHRNAVKYMRQSVRITGLDQPMFAKMIEAIAGVQNMLTRQVDKNNIIEWAPSKWRSTWAICTVGTTSWSDWQTGSNGWKWSVPQWR